MGAILTQFFPPKAQFTEENLPSLVGKVFIVTGANSGVGFELAQILYAKGGTVYLACRSQQKAAAAVTVIQSRHSTSKGRLEFLLLDLADLPTIKSSVSAFLRKETRLDVLWNNAGIAQVPAGSVTAQGHEAHMGTNCLGPLVLTTLLLPVLTQTVSNSPPAAVRVVFTASGIMELLGPRGGISLEEQIPGQYSRDPGRNYSASKAGNWFLAAELDRQVRDRGIVCVAQSPGSLQSPGWDRMSWPLRLLFRSLLHHPRMGAYTELWAGLGPDITAADGGRLALPWGRWHPCPDPVLLRSMKTPAEGGDGLAAAFWDWCLVQTKEYIEGVY